MTEEEIYQLEERLYQVRKERDHWSKAKGGKSNYAMSQKLVVSLEKQLAELLNKTEMNKPSQ